MRNLFLSLLFIIPLAVSAGESRMIKVPYVPVLGDEMTMADESICDKQALVSAKALQNAKIEITLEEQLKVWDEFTASDSAKDLNQAELKLQRELIIMAWEMFKRYPDLDPNEYGTYVYESCAYDKINNTDVQF